LARKVKSRNKTLAALDFFVKQSTLQLPKL